MNTGPSGPESSEASGSMPVLLGTMMRSAIPRMPQNDDAEDPSATGRGSDGPAPVSAGMSSRGASPLSVRTMLRTSETIRIRQGARTRHILPVQVDRNCTSTPSQCETPTTSPWMSPESEATTCTEPLVGSSAMESPMSVYVYAPPDSDTPTILCVTTMASCDAGWM